MKFEACNIGCNNEDENFYTLKAIDLKENIKIWRSSLTLQELFNDRYAVQEILC